MFKFELFGWIRSILLSGIASTIIVSSGYSDDRRLDKSRLTLMTINTYFMWDGRPPEDGSSRLDTAIPWKNSPIEADEHMEAISKIIARHNPDIINLVEVEDKQAVEHLNSTFLAGRGYKTYFAQGRDSFTGQDVALLTRIDPEGNEIHFDNMKGTSGSTSKKLTKQYRAQFTISGLKIFMVGVHFLARPNDSSRRENRQAQADAVRRIVKQNSCVDCEVIVLGDFNDYDGKTGFRDHIDSTPITSVFPIIRRLEPGTIEDDLINLSGQIPKGARYTAFWDKNDNNQINPPRELTSIDHILVSKNLNDKLESVFIDQDMNVILGSNGFVSDHYPIIAHFNMSDGSTSISKSMKFVSILPNPIGDEQQNEEAILVNNTDAAIILNGWKIIDERGRFWSLDSAGSVNANSEITIKRNGQPMAMTNTGDVIEIRDADNKLIDTISYSSTVEGQHVFAN